MMLIPLIAAAVGSAACVLIVFGLAAMIRAALRRFAGRETSARERDLVEINSGLLERIAALELVVAGRDRMLEAAASDNGSLSRALAFARERAADLERERDTADNAAKALAKEIGRRHDRGCASCHQLRGERDDAVRRADEARTRFATLALADRCRRSENLGSDATLGGMEKALKSHVSTCRHCAEHVARVERGELCRSCGSVRDLPEWAYCADAFHDGRRVCGKCRTRHGGSCPVENCERCGYPIHGDIRCAFHGQSIR